jgi:hypothetical protein
VLQAGVGGHMGHAGGLERGACCVVHWGTSMLSAGAHSHILVLSSGASVVVHWPFNHSIYAGPQQVDLNTA